MDEACALIKTEMDSMPAELDELSRRENEITGKNLDYKEMDIQNVLAIEKLLRKCRGNGWS